MLQVEPKRVGKVLDAKDEHWERRSWINSEEHSEGVPSGLYSIPNKTISHFDRASQCSLFHANA